MFNITINVRPTTTTNNITKAEDKPKKEKVTVKVVTWVGAIAAVVACAKPQTQNPSSSGRGSLMSGGERRCEMGL